MSTSKSIHDLTKIITTSYDDIEVKDWIIKTRPDDAAYASSRELWRAVPRGCADIKWGSKWEGRLRGFPKFGYENEKCYEFDGSAPVSHYLFVTKENGECFHFTCSPRIQEQRLFAFGSKNVHLAVVLSKDEDFYTQDWIPELQQKCPGPRFGYAFQLVKQMVDVIRERSKVQITWTEFLDELSTSRSTAIAEACDTKRAEHLVSYDKPQLFWLGWRNAEVDSFLSVSPDEARARFVRWGWDVPKFATRVPVNADRIGEIIQYFQTSKNTEGAVQYVVCTDGSTRAFVKVKNFDYIRRRAVREKVKQGVSNSVLRNRIKNLHVPFDEKWMHECQQFNAWIQIRRSHGKISDHDIDQFYMKYENEFSNVQESERERCIREWDIRDSSNKLVIVVGAPCQGSGKTRFSIVLLRVLTENGIRATRICQDDCGGRRKEFLKQFAESVADKRVEAIIVDKYNDATNRADYAPCGQRIFVGFHHSTGSMVDHCLQNVLKRSNRHPSFRPSDNMSPQQLSTIMKSFESKWTFPDEDEGFCASISLDVQMSTKEQIDRFVDEIDRAHLLKLHAPDEMILQGLSDHIAYECKCATLAPPKSNFKVLFWKIELDQVAVRRLCASVPPHMTINSTFHVTLVYYKNEPNPELESKLAAWNLRETQVTIKELCWDDRSYAAKVDAEGIPRDLNQTLHVTLALSPGTPASHAHEMVKSPLGSTQITPTKIQGLISCVSRY